MSAPLTEPVPPPSLSPPLLAVWLALSGVVLVLTAVSLSVVVAPVLVPRLALVAEVSVSCRLISSAFIPARDTVAMLFAAVLLFGDPAEPLSPLVDWLGGGPGGGPGGLPGGGPDRRSVLLAIPVPDVGPLVLDRWRLSLRSCQSCDEVLLPTVVAVTTPPFTVT